MRATARAPLLEVGKHSVDLLERHSPRGDERWQQQVLLGRQAGIDAALLRAVPDPQTCNPVRRQRDRLATVDHYRTRPAADEAEQRFARCGPPRAIAAEQRHAFAALD